MKDRLNHISTLTYNTLMPGGINPTPVFKVRTGHDSPRNVFIMYIPTMVASLVT